jgi:hypothetical protein
MTDNRQQIMDDGQQTTDNSAVSGQWSVVRFFAHLLSYIFHPLFVPVYVCYFLTFIHPSYFTGFGIGQKLWTIIQVAYIMVFFPLITVLLLRALKIIDSFFLKTQKDRIIPYIACGIYYFWIYLVFKNRTEIPQILTSFTFGVFLASSGALIANIFYKISMHAIGMGGVLGVFIIIMYGNTMLMTWPLCLALLIAGSVCTSRMIVSDHQPKEIYAGILLGLICQFIGAAMVL